MARFRVGNHRQWRTVPVAEPSSKKPAATRAAPARTRAPDPPSPNEQVGMIRRDLRSLGVLAWPARTYDLLFGNWHGRGATFFAVRFLIVMLAVGLLASGVSGDAPIMHKTGDYRTITPTTVVNTYITEAHVHTYPVMIRESAQLRSMFDSESGAVWLPHIEEDTAAYAVQVRLVRKDPGVKPVLLLSPPHNSHVPISPTSDDGITLNYPPIRLVELGKWEFAVHSNRGIGPVEMHLSIAKAPMEVVQLPNPGWLQAGGAAAVLLIMLGAYTPGARLLRERRRIEKLQETDVWAEAATDLPPRGVKGYARMHPMRPGVLAWKRPGKDAPEKLARMPGRGWIIRLD